MSWIQTFTGRRFFPIDPRAEDIDIRDIAHSLSLQCRFNGHCLMFYSVAEHAVRVSRIVAEHNALWGLLHDAAEAYMSDLPRPVKQQMPHFGAAEDHLLEIIVRHFGLSWPMPQDVRRADDVLLATELRDLMRPIEHSWRIDAAPLPDRIEPVSATAAEKMFLDRFAQLTGTGAS